MLRDEAELLALSLLEERFDTMADLNIKGLQDEARSAYEAYYARDLVSDEAQKFSALQVIMLAEIAQQLARIATQLEDGRISILEGDDIVEKLSRLGSIIENATDR